MKPRRLFIFLAVAIVACEWLLTLVFGDEAIDIPLHDTYFVIARWTIAWMIALFVLLIAFIYRMGEKYHVNYNKWLTLGHFISTILWVFYLLKFPFIPHKYFGFDNNAKDPYESMVYASTLFVVFIFLSLLFFFLNLILGFIKRKKSH